MLDPLLLGVLLHELADEARVPQLRGDAQVLAAPHQRVRLAPLGRRRHALLAEVLLLAAGLRYESTHLVLAHVPNTTETKGNSPPVHDQRVLPRHQLLVDRQLAARRQPPGPRPECRVQDAPVLDLGQVDDAVGLDLDVLGVHGRLQRRRRLRRERRRAQPVVRLRPVDRRLAAVAVVGGVVVGGVGRRCRRRVWEWVARGGGDGGAGCGC